MRFDDCSSAQEVLRRLEGAEKGPRGRYRANDVSHMIDNHFSDCLEFAIPTSQRVSYFLDPGEYVPRFERISLNVGGLISCLPWTFISWEEMRQHTRHRAGRVQVVEGGVYLGRPDEGQI